MSKRLVNTLLQSAAEHEELRARLEEAEETLRAIRSGEVDALVVTTEQGERLFTLKGAEHSYRSLIEDMNEGAVTLSLDGNILYCNRRFAEILKSPLESVMGSAFCDWVASEDQAVLRKLLWQDEEQPRRRAEVLLLASDGTLVSSQLSISDLYPEEQSGYFCMVVTDLTEHNLVEKAVVAEKMARTNLESSERSRRVLLSMLEDQKLADEAVRASEEQYRSLFEDSPISLWVEDFSEVKLRFDRLKAAGVQDVPAYLLEHPDLVSECAHQVRVLDVNSAAVKLYHAASKAELLGRLMDVLPTLPVEQIQHQLMMVCNGQLNFEREGVEETLTGEKIHVSLRWTVAPGYEDTFARVIVSTIDVTERKRAEEHIQLQIQRLRALRSIDLAISSSFNLDLTLDILLNQVITQLKVDAASVLLYQPFTRTLEYAAGRGFHSSAIRGASVRLGEGYAGMAVLERRMIHSSNLTETNRDLPPLFLLMLKEEGFVDYYCVPLLVKGEVKGVLESYHRSMAASDSDWLDFLDALAGQAAIAIEDAALFENLQHSNQELFQAYDATIEGWSHALDLRDQETEGHTQRVTQLAVELARRFGFTSEQLIHIRWGALLHDIGKMGVPDTILLKPDKLTDDEWEIMRKHPTFAFEMLSPIAYLKASLDIPYCHHEKWDGTGYPRGLKGNLIPLAARLFAVVDVWDALRSDRPYRKAWSVEKTSQHIRSLSGTHFDPKVVEPFLKIVEAQPGK